MGSQWRGALRTRHAIADLMKSCWYSNASLMALASTELFIISRSFPGAHLRLWFEQTKCVWRVKNQRTFVLVNTRAPFFQNSCPPFSSWGELFAFWQLGWRPRKLWLQFVFVMDVLLLISQNLPQPAAHCEWAGALEAFCLCQPVNGRRPIDLMEMNRGIIRASMQMYVNHFGVWWPISCGLVNNNNVLTRGKGLDVRSVCPSPGPLHGHDLFLKRANRDR